MTLPFASQGAKVEARHERPGSNDGSTEASSTVFRLNIGIDIERQVLTVLFADVVHNCRLIEIDDLKTVFHLEWLRLDVIRPIAQSHGADIVRNFGGDGLVLSLAEPASAVRCAISLQQHLKARETCWSDNERMSFRMGIAMGTSHRSLRQGMAFDQVLMTAPQV